MRSPAAKFEMVIVKSESTLEKYTEFSNPPVMERFTRLWKSPRRFPLKSKDALVFNLPNFLDEFF